MEDRSSHPKAVVIGHPIKHSRSPLIHGFWLAEHGLGGDYGILDVAPEDLPEFADKMRAGAWVGANVTVPHKETMLRLADQATDEAQAIGAANTLWVEDGNLIAGNTDAHGFAANLDQSAPGWDQTSRALLFGAGGAARAVIYALLNRGFDSIRIVNRTAARVDILTQQFGPKVQHADQSLDQELGQAGLIINSTSLGMTGADPWPYAMTGLNEDAVVNDLVYAPLHTELLHEAKERGNRVVDGLGMLLHQAAPGFHKWFGVMPEVTVKLRARIVRDLEGNG